YDIVGGGTPDPPSLGTEVILHIHTYCYAASTSPGSAVQVDIAWDDGNGPQGDTIVIGLDALTSQDIRDIPMWTGYGTTVTMAATLIGDGQFGIEWQEDIAIP